MTQSPGSLPGLTAISSLWQSAPDKPLNEAVSACASDCCPGEAGWPMLDQQQENIPQGHLENECVP